MIDRLIEIERLIALVNAMTVDEAFTTARRVVKQESDFFAWDLDDEEIEVRAASLIRSAKKAIEQLREDQKELERLREYKANREMYG